ncbi:MAG TPA: 3'-5' exonuclease [Candidatus Corynebacterium avicola]|uniref:3'-5' exonuclease n=1 Tax=Candidatus Corynebacterium avicola TaxID=2838527 RepID=A0A9D1RRD5_9CORY|nr:3'-5' exonuclease [Candidatus Corynebacterium avicola]
MGTSVTPVTACPGHVVEWTTVTNRPSTLARSLTDALRDCVILDCETTGLDPENDRIIEVAAVHLVDGEIEESIHSLVDPGRPLPRVITELTGVTDHDLAGQPSAPSVLGDLVRLTAGRILVGHNVSFDIAFVDGELDREGQTGLEVVSTLCTAESARELIPREQVGRYRLDRLADVLELRHSPVHRAHEDVLATADLLRWLQSAATAR